MNLSFGALLFRATLPEVLVLDEIYQDKSQLKDFLYKVNKKSNQKTREFLFRHLGIENPTKFYRGFPIKFIQIILNCIGLNYEMQKTRKQSEDGNRQYALKIISDDVYKEVILLIESGDESKVIEWLNAQYEIHGRQKMKCGVYKIIHKPTGKIYIGSTYDLKLREKQHIYHLRNKKHRNYQLQKLWNNFHEENFVFEILEKTTDYAAQERTWIKNADKNLLLNSTRRRFKKISISQNIFKKLQTLSLDLETDIFVLTEEILDSYFNNLKE